MRRRNGRPSGGASTRLLVGDPAEQLPRARWRCRMPSFGADRRATLRNLVLCFFLFYVLSAATPFVYGPLLPVGGDLLAPPVSRPWPSQPSPISDRGGCWSTSSSCIWQVYIGLVNNQAFKNRFEHMDEYYASPVKLRDKVEFLYGSRDSPTGDLTVRDPDAGRRAGQDARLIDNDASLQAWRMSAGRVWSQDGRRPMKPKMVIISVSGGAARSAYWACLRRRQARRGPRPGTPVSDLPPFGADHHGDLGGDARDGLLCRAPLSREGRSGHR